MRRLSLSSSLEATLGENGQLVARPEVTECTICSGPLTFATETTGWILTAAILPVKVVTITCDSCRSNYYFDGRAHGLVNFKNRLLLPMEGVLDFLYQYSSTGTAVSAWLNNLLRFNVDIMSSLKEFVAVPSVQRGHVSEAMAGAAELLTFTSSTFKCCENPSAITMDGTVISINFERLPNFQKPWRLTSPSNRRATTRAERQLPVLSHVEASYLKALSKKERSVVRTFVEYDERNATSPFARLLFHCTNVPIFAPTTPQSTIVYLETDAIPMAKFMRKRTAPILTLVPYSVKNILLHLSQRQLPTEQMLNNLALNAPLFFTFYRCLRLKLPESSPLWEVFYNGVENVLAIFASLEQKKDSLGCQELTPDEVTKLYSDMQHPNCPNIDLQELWHTGCYFPGYPIIRKVSKQLWSGAREDMCTKHAKHGSALGPGVVLFYCLKHSKCIGFIVQREPESLTMVYEAIVTRFRMLPKTIIYDNGCNLYEYIQNRTPQLFRDTQVLVDSFHYHSHTACAPTFNSQQNNIAKGLNSSLCEQKNKKFKRSKLTSPFMRFRTFVAFLRFSVYKVNEEVEEIQDE
jgi:CxC4 like cysteine cluster associated with KDZ transposases